MKVFVLFNFLFSLIVNLDKSLYIPAQAEMVLSAVQKSLPAGQQKHYSTENQEVNKLLLEKEALQQCLFQQEKQYSFRIKSLKSELSKNKKDMVRRI